MGAHLRAVAATAFLATTLWAASAFGQATTFKSSEQGRAVEAAAAGQSPEERYQQLAALETEYAGDVEYDYFLGIAALDAGHSSVAVFALQRAVATSPSYAGARMELARAYYAAGDYESARREFELLQKQDPPPQVEDAINQYLDAIDRRSSQYRPQFSAVIEAGGGYDSNANGATDARVFEGFDLNERSHAQSSGYYGAGVSGQLSYPVVPRWRLLGEATAQQRNYPDANYVDTTLAHLGAGIERAHEEVTLGAMLSSTYVALDGDRNNINSALDLSMVYAFAPNWQLGISGRAGALRFADELAIEDVDMFLGSGAITRTFDSLPRVQLAVSVTGGRDVPRDDDSPYGRSLIGGRISVYVSPRSTMLFSVSAAVLRSNYGDAFFSGQFQDGSTFSLYRDDTQVSARVGLDWKDFPARHWGIGTQITYIDNHSTLSLFQYDRVDASLMLRREFR